MALVLIAKSPFSKVLCKGVARSGTIHSVLRFSNLRTARVFERGGRAAAKEAEQDRYERGDQAAQSGATRRARTATATSIARLTNWAVVGMPDRPRCAPPTWGADCGCCREKSKTTISSLWRALRCGARIAESPLGDKSPRGASSDLRSRNAK
jgi:hypothetical protein